MSSKVNKTKIPKFQDNFERFISVRNKDNEGNNEADNSNDGKDENLEGNKETVLENKNLRTFWDMDSSDEDIF